MKVIQQGVRQRAQAILDQCGPNTPREQIAWAAGVFLCHNAVHFDPLPLFHGHNRLPGWGWASTVNGRAYNCGRQGLQIHAGGTAGLRVVPVVTWQEIAALATLERIGVALHRRIVDAVRERKCRTLLRSGNPPGPQQRPWGEVVADGAQLASQAWERCWPGAIVARQLDILDLLVAR